MVTFTGGASSVDGQPGLFEWSDVIVVIEDNVIVDYFTQFSGDALPNSGIDVEIGSFNVRLTQLTYKHLGNAVGVNNLLLSSAAQFTQSAGGFVISGKLTNNGLASFLATTTFTEQIENNHLMTVGDSNTDFMLLKSTDGVFTLSGSGDLRMRGGYLTGEGGQSSLTELQNSSKITGHGAIGASFGWASFPANAGYLKIANTAAGTIEANVSGETLTIETQLSAINPVVNAGLLAASNGGKLLIRGSVIEQSGAGTIKAFNGSTVELNSFTLRGGTIDGQGTGVVKVEGFTNLIEGIDITATGTLNVGRGVSLKGSIENRGKIVSSDFDVTTTIDSSGLVLTGGGTWHLVDGYYEADIQGAAGAILTNIDNTIFGVGGIVGGNLAIANSGVISARPDTQYSTNDEDVLTIDQVSSVSNGFGGILEANGAATLRLVNTQIHNDGGLIRAIGVGSKVVTSNTTITDGTLHTDVNGLIFTGSTRLVDVTTTSTTKLEAGGGTVLDGAIVNAGTIFVDDFNAAILIHANDVLLSGGGNVVLYDNYGDAAIVGNAPGAVLTNFNNKIRGDGYIGGGNLTLANSGVIYADADPREDGVGNLAVRDLASFTNVGYVDARNGANLHLNNPGDGKIANTGGFIRAVGDGSVVHLNNAVIQGGTITGIAGGRFTMGDATWDGSTSKVTATNVNISNGVLHLKGAIQHSGQIDLGDRGALKIDAHTTLTGGGSIFLYYGYIAYGAVVAGTPGRVLYNVENAIGGNGEFGGYSGLVYVNGANAVVTANQVGGTLNVATGNAITNYGRFVADGGTLNLVDNLTGSGRIEIINGGMAIVDQGTDHKVVMIGATAETVSLERREGGAGGFDFSINGMGVGDRIRLDMGAPVGAESDFFFTHAAGGGTLAVPSFADGNGVAYQIRVNGDHSYGQFQLLGGPDGRWGFVRVASRDGGAGNDTLTAVAGGERVVGLGGNDTLIGRNGDDLLDGSLGSDTADYRWGTSGVTVSLAITGAQAIGGGLGSDRLISIEHLTGSGYGDRLTGDAGANRLTGNGGGDTLEGGAGPDILDGGAGTDTVTYANASSGIQARLSTGKGAGGDAQGDTYISIENVVGSAFDDTIVGADGVGNVLTGGDGVDNIRGLSGADRLNGDAGNDILEGGADADMLFGGADTDTITYAFSTAAVQVRLNTGSGLGGEAQGDTYSSIENVVGSAFGDTIVGSDGVGNVLSGGGGADTILGRSGDDTLKGEAGNDVLDGGAGADSLDGGANTDTASYASSAAGVQARLTTGAGLGGDAQGDTYIAVENLIGSAFNDTLVGSNGVANVLAGGNGDDTILGNSGSDTLIGGLGKDVLAGGADNDRFVFALPADSSVGANRDTVTDFEDFADNDTIDLSGFAGSLSFIGAAAFSAANQVRAVQAGANVLVQINTAGVGGAESEIMLTNTALAQIDASDFFL